MSITKWPTLTFTECNEHGYRGAMPCPWPLCKKGVKTKSIDTTFPLLKRDEALIYHRHSCKNYFGEDRYYWDSTDNPGDWNANALTFNEIQRVNGHPKSHVVYHYTTLEGLYKILESNELWMTDYTYLNDAKEIEHGYSLVQIEIEKILDRLQNSQKNKLLLDFLAMLKQSQLPRICLTSFSLDGDSLSQWRGYSRGRMGVSIGFDVFAQYWIKLKQCYFHQVIYDYPTQIEIIQNYLYYHEHLLENDLKKVIKNRSGKRVLGSRKKMTEYYCQKMLSRLYSLISFFKDTAFTDEREVRLVYTEEAELYERSELKKAPKRFRVTDGLIIPYCTTKDLRRNWLNSITNDGDLKLPVKEIIIGPNDKSALIKNGVTEYLESMEYDDVDVRISTIPFR